MFSDEIDGLLVELAASLEPSQRRAFEAAARAALAAAGCSGCGAAYRLLIPIQRAHWDPPSDERLAHSGPRHRGGKLVNAPAISADSASGLKSARSRWEGA
jgi:hypothetical protein